MNRKTLAEFTHKAENFLSLENNTYKQWVFRYTFLELEKDLGTKGDISTKMLFSDGKYNVKAKIIAKSEGIVAGLREIQYFLVDSDPNFRPSIKGNFEIDFKLNDGDRVKNGDIILEISSDVHSILAVERVLLNLLMRMSAVATFTANIKNLIKEHDVLITPTRKTLWGLIDKKAVLIGGGGTHRMNLSDSVILKDTHLDVLNRNFDDVFSKIEKFDQDFRFLEIEVNTVAEALDVAKRFSVLIKQNKLSAIGCIMFDNIPAKGVLEALNAIKKDGFYNDLLFEASGNINEKNVLEYAKTGVDIISMGCLTDGVKRFDLSMKME